jgi:hypothetical protein
MLQKLGIAGLPADPCAVEVAARDLGLEPIYFLDEVDVAGDLSAATPVVALSDLDEDSLVAQFRAQNIVGVWIADGRRLGHINGALNRLGFHQLACVSDSLCGCWPIVGARAFSTDELSVLAEPGREGLPMPLWVRAECGGGDASCMRVEHPSDLSLAVEKARKRGATNALRVQPAVAGEIYRLLAFKTGRDILLFDVIEEWVTSSVYRVPLGMAMAVPRRGALMAEIEAEARVVNRMLPVGWGYVEMEFVRSEATVVLTDVRAPARLGGDIQRVAFLSQGVDLLRASLECAVGRIPTLTPTREVGVALTWLLTRSGEVTSIEGVEEATAMPGVVEVQVAAREGDILTHVVDRPTRERGGFIVARGGTAAVAKARLEAAREQVWINTSPALS